MVGGAVNLPNLTPWYAGVELDEEAMNALSYAQAFLLSPPEVEVKQTSAQSISTGSTTATLITWSSETKDTDTMWSSGTNVTVHTTGWYEVEWAVKWATKADNTGRWAGIALNGDVQATNLLGISDYVNDSGTAPEIRGCYDIYLTSGDYIGLAVMQASGASLSTGSSSANNSQTMLRARWSSN